MPSHDKCLFCRIISGDIPAKKQYEDDDVVAFHDINPQAPTHVLICPRTHVASLAEANASHEAALGRLLTVAATLARERGLESFRTVVNSGQGAGQSVFHVHVHLLGGRGMSWPPG